MVAISRFVEFSATAQTFATGSSNDTGPGKGTRGYFRGTGLSTGDDSFTITLNSNDQLTLSIGGVGPHTITLTSGTDLDPRFVARDIEYRIHNANSNDKFKFAQCEFRNGGGGPNNFNSFILHAGVLGSGTQPSITAGPRDARATLGFDSSSTADGVSFGSLFPSSTYTGNLVVSGSYGGQFDDFYTLMIAENETVGNPTGGGGNTYAGTAQTGGLYTGAAQNTYLVTVDTTNGSVMGGGSGNVPRFTVVGTPSDTDADPIELLYAQAWYDIANLGLRMRFSDAPFGNGDTFTVVCNPGSGTVAAVGAAKYIFSSNQEDSTKAHGISPITTQTTGTQLGTRGVTVAFSNSGTLSPRERWNIMCRGPQPLTEGVTQLNFGNVTVSTQSPVKVVWFEIISGAVSMSTVKFSLQSHGTFSHHDAGSSDTEFHFGTVGAGNDAPGGGSTSNSQVEFPVDSTGVGSAVAGDIDSDSPPSNFFATKADLAVVASADLAQSLGNYLGALVSDYVFLAIKLGANETGANSTINYRVYFDFS